MTYTHPEKLKNIFFICLFTNLFLHRITEYICQYRNHVELVHLLCQQRVEGQHPQTEDQLVLHLEVHSAWQYWQKCRNAVHGYEGKAIFVNPKHHLQTTAHGLDVLVVLVWRGGFWDGLGSFLKNSTLTSIKWLNILLWFIRGGVTNSQKHKNK